MIVASSRLVELDFGYCSEWLNWNKKGQICKILTKMKCFLSKNINSSRSSCCKYCNRILSYKSF